MDHIKKCVHDSLNWAIFLAQSAFETGFISSKHTDEDSEKTIEAARKIMATL